MSSFVADSTPSNAPEAPVPNSSWAALGVLLLVYLLNFLDRTLIYILFPPIKKELVFTDLQLALLGSTSFVIFYTVLGIPFGRLADRVSRRKLIAVGLAIWSLFSGLTGFADSFWTIFACRVLVGVGEATLGPAAMSLLSDLFPPSRRATVQSLYSSGIPLGAAAAFFLGGQVAATWGWRWAFYLLGFPGLALAAVVLMLPEPVRGKTESGAQQAPADWRLLAKVPALRWHVMGYALLAVATNSLSIWIPSLLNRAYSVPLTEIGNLSGISMAVSGGLSTAFGGVAADWFRRKSAGGRLRFGAMLALGCAPLWLGLLYSGNLTVMYACFFGLAGMGLAWLGPAAADIHDMVGPNLRGLGIAAYFFVVNGVGYGIAPPLVGWISDRLGVATDPGVLATALLICPVVCLLSGISLWTAARRRDG